MKRIKVNLTEKQRQNLVKRSNTEFLKDTILEDAANETEWDLLEDRINQRFDNFPPRGNLKEEQQPAAIDPERRDPALSAVDSNFQGMEHNWQAIAKKLEELDPADSSAADSSAADSSAADSSAADSSAADSNVAEVSNTTEVSNTVEKNYSKEMVAEKILDPNSKRGYSPDGEDSSSVLRLPIRTKNPSQKYIVFGAVATAAAVTAMVLSSGSSSFLNDSSIGGRSVPEGFTYKGTGTAREQYQDCQVDPLVDGKAVLTDDNGMTYTLPPSSERLSFTGRCQVTSNVHFGFYAQGRKLAGDLVNITAGTQRLRPMRSENGRAIQLDLQKLLAAGSRVDVVIYVTKEPVPLSLEMPETAHNPQLDGQKVLWSDTLILRQ